MTMLRPRRNSDEEEACGLLLAPVSQPSMESPTSGLLVLLDFSSWVTFCGLASLFPDVERLFSDRLTVVWVQWIVNELAYIKATTHSLAFSKESINVSFNTNMTKSVMSVTGDSLKYISCFIQFLQKILQDRKIKKKVRPVVVDRKPFLCSWLEAQKWYQQAPAFHMLFIPLTKLLSQRVAPFSFRPANMGRCLFYFILADCES